jgi:excisionase family DNA binding protein
MSTLSETLISSGEAARMLEIHPLAIQKLIRQGRIPAEKVANRWLISRAFLEEFTKTYEGKRGRPRKKRKYTKRSPRWKVK